MNVRETTKIRSGFHLGDGAVVLCHQLSDGSWEAWIEKAGSQICDGDGKSLLFFSGPTRFNAQCNAARWYEERETDLGFYSRLQTSSCYC
jgi:hypothetical protein